MLTPAELAALHLANYASPAQIVAAPGRVNLIGEHTDYCDGFVMPAAIDFATLIAISPRTDGRLLAHSVNFEDRIDYPLLDHLESRLVELHTLTPEGKRPKTHWSDYPSGVLWALKERRFDIASGFSLTIVGDVPLGAGLSSSASVEVASAFAILGVLNIAILPPKSSPTSPTPPASVAPASAPTSILLSDIALLCQRAENAFVGANVGIMDQFVICCGAQDHALMLDCRSLDFTLAPIPPDVRIVICNSMVSHSVAGGEYNTRRAEMEAGLRILQAHRPEIKALRDATVQDLDRWGPEMPPASLKRCRHVVTEDNRVLAAVDAFNASDLTRFGQLMHEAHVSFRDDFEASCPEVDILVDLATRQPGCYGARLTGGGFGGCTVNLVAAEATETFTQAMRSGYLAATNIAADIYISRASAGAHAVTL